MNNASWLGFLLASLTCTLAVGCADDDGGTSSVDTTNVSAFCRATARTGCSKMYACLTEAERAAKKLPATLAECERKLESGCEDIFDTCEDGTYAYSPLVASDCLDEMQVATCNDAGEAWLDAPSCSQVCHRVAGSLKIAWQFSPVYACSALGIEYVDVVAFGSDGGFTDRFYCFDGGGLTGEMPYGEYDVHIELFDTTGVKRWGSPVMRKTLDDDIVDVGTITIPVGQ
ncbi:MAG: hypothetical protein HOV81_38865 [Kofleriaceae bacterium]|nr:hypothetical protein [Kofleriaceae bacterium]